MASRKQIYSNVEITGDLRVNNLDFPTTDGTNGQVLTTDGTGNISWSTVSGGTGSGSTSPGGNNGDIQWNNGGTFDGGSTMNYDSSIAKLHFQMDESGTSNILDIGELDLSFIGGSGITRGSSLVYNNSLSGLSANTIFMVGDTGEMLGDNTMITGYLDAVNDVTNVILTNPYITQLFSSSDGYNTFIGMQGSRGMQLQTSDSGGTQTARVTIDPTRGISNYISDGNNFNVSTDSNTPLLVTSAVTINNSYTLPNFDGSLGQVLQTDGGGSVSWATVSGGTGSGSTLPAGSSSEIQFNNAGSFGASSGLTFDVSKGNVFNTTSSYGTSGTTAHTHSMFVGGGSSAIPLNDASGFIYLNDNDIGGSVSVFNGNLTDLGLEDFSVFAGYNNVFSSVRSGLLANPSGVILRKTDSLNFDNTLEILDSYIALNFSSGSTFNSIVMTNGGINNVISTGSTYTIGSTFFTDPVFSIDGGTPYSFTLATTGSTAGGFGGVIGGFDNTINAQYLSSIIGGYGNTITANGVNGGIIGGLGNTLDTDNSWIIGGNGISATTDFTTYVENFSVESNISLVNPTTVMSGGTAGAAAAIPATPAGYLQINIGGIPRLMPYYDYI